MIDPFGNRVMSFLLFCRHMGLVFTISETWKEKEAVNEVWKLSLLSGKKSDYLEPVSCLHVVWRLSQEENGWKIMIFHYFMFSQPALPFVPKEKHNFTTYQKEGLRGRGEFLSQSN